MKKSVNLTTDNYNFNLNEGQMKDESEILSSIDQGHHKRVNSKLGTNTDEALPEIEMTVFNYIT